MIGWKCEPNERNCSIAISDKSMGSSEERETYEEYIQEEQETEETTDEEPVTEEPEVMVIDNGKKSYG